MANYYSKISSGFASTQKELHMLRPQYLPTQHARRYYVTAVAVHFMNGGALMSRKTRIKKINIKLNSFLGGN